MMDILSSFGFWHGLGVIIWVNLLLSGDNAVVIALAARSLPPRQQRMAVLWGSGAAIVMRVVLTLFAVALLQLPWLKLVGGLLLLWIGVKLLVPEDGDDDVASSDNLYQAIKTILIADLVMSLDNVIAVAAAAEQAAAADGTEGIKNTLIVLGLAISIPIVIFGSTIMIKVMARYPIIITLGAALLGYIAGDIGATDPALKDWFAGIGVVYEKGRPMAAGWSVAMLAGFAGASFVAALGLWLGARKQAGAAARAEPPKG
jgi:YjbE family integral membrane protein